MILGIRDQTKRKSIFSYLHVKDKAAYFFIIFKKHQYSDLCDERLWKNECGGEIIFSHGNKNYKVEEFTY